MKKTILIALAVIVITTGVAFGSILLSGLIVKDCIEREKLAKAPEVMKILTSTGWEGVNRQYNEFCQKNNGKISITRCLATSDNGFSTLLVFYKQK